MKTMVKKTFKKIKKTYEQPMWKWVLAILLISFLLEFLLEIFGRRSILKAALFVYHDPLVFLYNTSICFMTLSIALLFRRRVFILAFVLLLWLTMGVCNCVVLGYRITPFSFIDITMISDVFSMMDIYFNTLQQILIFGGLILVVIVIVVAFITVPKMKGKIHIVKASIVVLTSFTIVYVMTIIAVKTTLIADEFTNLGTAYKDYGFAYCFANSVVDVGIGKPEDYSQKMINTYFLDTYHLDDKAYPKVKPDIIVVQLESFIDIGRVTGVNTDKEPIANFKAFQEEYPSGWLTVPAIGAGTANTEFEIITGMKSKIFGAGEYPYKTILTDTPCESMPQVLKRIYGYGTHSIHNNKAKFYSRDESYASLGFDTFTSLEYMKDVNYTQTGWAKDDCLPAEIMKALDSDEESDFILCISVQGHGRYPKDELKCEEHVKVTLDSEDPDLTNMFGYYVNQCYEMDQMILELKDMLDGRGDPYVLVLYGDHIPALPFEEDQFSSGEQNQTEYVIVNNIGLEMEDRDIYTYELSDYLMRSLKMKRGIMQRLHEKYFDAETGDDEAFKTAAEAMQYDMLYGEHYIYNRIKEYSRTDMKLGIDDIVVESAEFNEATGYIVVKGQNFTTFSMVIIDDERIDTGYIDDETLIVIPEDESDKPEAGTKVEVAQIDKDKHELTRSNAVPFQDK